MLGVCDYSPPVPIDPVFDVPVERIYESLRGLVSSNLPAWVTPRGGALETEKGIGEGLGC